MSVPYNERMKATMVTVKDIDHLAQLANIPLTNDQAEELMSQVGITVSYVSTLQSLPTEGVTETAQVTGLENIYRNDEIDTSRILSQEDALSQSRRVYNGYFVVDQVLDEQIVC